MSDTSGDARRAVLRRLTAQIVSAHLDHSKLPPDRVPELIRQVYQALATADAPAPAAPERPQPAVPVRRSVFPDHIVCLEDGKRLRMLKRHLLSDHGLTPEQYRQRWDLPPDYPMVAPNYAARRSTLARQFGLGRRREEPARGEEAAPLPSPPEAEAAPEAGAETASGAETAARKASARSREGRGRRKTTRATRKGGGTGRG